MVIVIGAGQAGLACAYYLQKAGVEFLLLDNQVGPGGSWRGVWDTLTLFSGASFSSLPGMQMPAKNGDVYAADVVDYFTRYEERYEFPINRPVTVDRVDYDDGTFTVHTDDGTYTASHVIMATGIQSSPFVPSVPGSIVGQYWHTANYPGPDTFAGKKVAVVGAGNSGAQLVAELSEVADVRWLVREEPTFMPDELTGTEIFKRSRRRALAQLRGEEIEEERTFGDIVMIDSVRRARDEGRLNWEPMPDTLDELDVDHLIWATGYRPSLDPVRHLLDHTPEGLHFVGYGDWTGSGSATIVGVGPFAKRTVAAITDAS